MNSGCRPLFTRRIYKYHLFLIDTRCTSYVTLIAVFTDHLSLPTLCFRVGPLIVSSSPQGQGLSLTLVSR